MEAYVNYLISQVGMGEDAIQTFVIPQITNSTNQLQTAFDNINPTIIEHTVPGNYTLNVPANASVMYVTMCGGGGGGGSGNHSTAGGGGGASVIGYPIKVTPGQAWQVTVGAGGAGNADGGDTVLDSGLTFKIQCKGGKAGAAQINNVTAVGGNGGALIIQGITVKAGGNGGNGFGIVGDPGGPARFGFAGGGGGGANNPNWGYQGGECAFYSGGDGAGGFGVGGGGASAFHAGLPYNNVANITGIGAGGGGDGGGGSVPNGGIGYFKAIFRKKTNEFM